MAAQWFESMPEERTERLQVLLLPEELAAIEEFRFLARMPSQSAAVRELLKRGLAAAKIDKPKS